MAPKLRAAGLRQPPCLMGAQDDWVIQSTFFSMILGRLAGDEFDLPDPWPARFPSSPTSRSSRALRFFKQLSSTTVS